MVSFAARDARPRPEERVCRKTSANSEGAYARLEGWGRATRFALMLRDASQRIWAVEGPALASRCDAPQHEGERLLRMMARAKHQPAAVRNDGWRRFPVSGLLFTGNGATPTCRVGKGPCGTIRRNLICHHPSS